MRVQYFEWDESCLDELRREAGLMRLFNYLVVQQGGDVEEALRILRELQARGVLGPDVDLDEFEHELEDEEIVHEVEGVRQLTSLGERGLRRDALEQIFTSLRGRGLGNHPIPREGSGREPLPETHEFQFGDDV